MVGSVRLPARVALATVLVHSKRSMLPFRERWLEWGRVVNPIVPIELLRGPHGVTVSAHHITLRHLCLKRLDCRRLLSQGSDCVVLLAWVPVVEL